MTDPNPKSPARTPLSFDRVVVAAMAIADQGGLGTLTMRSLATALRVTPMSLYHHFASKDALLDALVDAVFSEIDLPDPDGDWQTELRRRADSARAVLGRHTWAIGLLESRTSPGAATLRHHETVVALLRRSGFPIPLAAHAYALLDSFVYGFALQEAALPFKGPETVAAFAEPMLQMVSAEEYPYLVEMMTDHIMQPGYDFGDEFHFGLDLLLDGLARMIAAV